MIDVAIGIFIGLRGHSENEAFDEIVDAVRKTGVGPGSIATALLTACDHEAPKPAIVRSVWSQLGEHEAQFGAQLATAGPVHRPATVDSSRRSRLAVGRKTRMYR